MKMRIAFDVKGTIDGPKQDQVLTLLKMFLEAGHEVVVWSNSYGYAIDAVNKHGLSASPMSKRTKGDVNADETQYYDLAVEDDRHQTWLAAKEFLFVDEIPDTLDEVLTLGTGLIYKWGIPNAIQTERPQEREVSDTSTERDSLRGDPALNIQGYVKLGN